MIKNQHNILSGGFVYQIGDLLQLLQTNNMINRDVCMCDKTFKSGTLFVIVNILIYKIDTALFTLASPHGGVWYHVIHVNNIPKVFRKLV